MNCSSEWSPRRRGGTGNRSHVRFIIGRRKELRIGAGTKARAHTSIGGWQVWLETRGNVGQCEFAAVLMSWRVWGKTWETIVGWTCCICVVSEIFSTIASATTGFTVLVALRRRRSVSRWWWREEPRLLQDRQCWHWRRLCIRAHGAALRVLRAAKTRHQHSASQRAWRHSIGRGSGILRRVRCRGVCGVSGVSAVGR